MPRLGVAAGSLQSIPLFVALHAGVFNTDTNIMRYIQKPLTTQMMEICLAKFPMLEWLSKLIYAPHAVVFHLSHTGL